MINIIIPTYKARETLPLALNSLLAQTKQMFFVTIVQDCDGEDYSDIIKKYKGMGLHISLLSTPTNQGPGMARQVGIDASDRFSHLMFLDSDDMLLPRAVEVLSREAGRTSADIVASGIIAERQYDEPTYMETAKTPVTWLHGKIYRTDYLKENNLRFLPNLRTNEDAYFNLVAWNNSSKAIRIEEYTYLWRDNKNSLTRQGSEPYAFFKKSFIDYIISQAEGLIALYRRNKLPVSLFAQTMINIYHYVMRGIHYKLDMTQLSQWFNKLVKYVDVSIYYNDPKFWEYVNFHIKSSELLSDGIFFFDKRFIDWIDENFMNKEETHKSNVFIMNGYPGSGKTSFENFVAEELGPGAKVLSTITPIKELAKQIGWDGTKTPKDRAFLSDLKDLLTKYNDYSFKYIVQEVIKHYQFCDNEDIPANKRCVFIDCREPKEIKRLVDKFCGHSCIITRNGAPQDLSNHADSEVNNFEYDIEIDNSSTLENLQKLAKMFIQEYLK